jgi:ubiquitin C-terminal hydrolase
VVEPLDLLLDLLPAAASAISPPPGLSINGALWPSPAGPLAAAPPSHPPLETALLLRPLETTLRGLRNLGKTCYLNACLQSLLATEAVRVHFLSQPGDTAANEFEGRLGHGVRPSVPTTAPQVRAEGELTSAMRSFVNEMHGPLIASAEAVRPVGLLRAVSTRHSRFGQRTEQDSHEVLRQLLEGIRSEEVERLKSEAEATTAASPLTKPKALPNLALPPIEPEPRTIIDEVFSGELRSTVVCCTCGSVSCAHEPFLDLSLPMPRRGRLDAQDGPQSPSSPRSPGSPSSPAEDSPVDSPAVASGGARGFASGSPGRGGGSSGSGREGGGSADLSSADLTDEVLAKLPSVLTAKPSQLHLGSCLAAFFAPETLRGDDAYDCDVCSKRAADAASKLGKEAKAAGKMDKAHVAGAHDGAKGERELAQPPSPKPKQPGLKWLQVNGLPRVLTLHLKRFRTTGRKVHKLYEHMPFPLVLDFSPFACQPGEPVKHYTQLSDGVARPPSAAHLSLYAVVEHQGTFVGGHYVAFVKIGGAWYRMNDSVVTQVSEATVLEAKAFMLFYQQTPSPTA